MNTKRLALCAMIVITLASQASAAISWCALWGTCPPPGPPPFKPTFEQGVQLVSPFGGSWKVNTDYFATEVTADTICKRLQCVFRPHLGGDSGGNAGAHSSVTRAHIPV